MDAFDESVRRGTATAATADACLRAFDAQISSKSWPEAVQATKSVAPAKRVLRWLWSSTLTREDVDDFSSSPAAMWLLACNAQLEGNVEFLWQWMTVDAGVFNGGADASHYTWRGILHRYMVNTKLFLLTMEKNTQADEAIDMVFTLAALKRGHSSHPLLQLTSLLPGLIVLVPNICTPYWPDTSLEAYQRLTDLVAVYVKGGTSLIPGVNRRDVYLARLELWRPRTPSPDQAIKILRTFAESRRHVTAHLTREDQKLIYNLAKASVGCLRKLGRNSECEEIAKIGTLCGAGRVISP